MKTLLPLLLLVCCSAFAAEEDLQWQYEELNSVVLGDDLFIDPYQNPESLILAAAMQAMLSTDYPSVEFQDDDREGSTSNRASITADTVSKTDPSSIVRGIYRDNITVWPVDSQHNGLLSKRLSITFANSQRTAEQDVHFFEPIINGKDSSIEGLVVHPAVYDGNRAYVNVRFRTFNHDNALVYSFIRENNDWKLDELASLSGETRWLLTEILQNQTQTPD